MRPRRGVVDPGTAPGRARVWAAGVLFAGAVALAACGTPPGSVRAGAGAPSAAPPVSTVDESGRATLAELPSIGERVYVSSADGRVVGYYLAADGAAADALELKLVHEAADRVRRDRPLPQGGVGLSPLDIPPLRVFDDTGRQVGWFVDRYRPFGQFTPSPAAPVPTTGPATTVAIAPR